MFVEVVSNGVCQSPNGIIENKEVLSLVLLEGRHQHLQDVPKVRNKLCARLLFQGRKRTAGRLLDTLIGIQNTLQQLEREEKEA